MRAIRTNPVPIKNNTRNNTSRNVPRKTVTLNGVDLTLSNICYKSELVREILENEKCKKENVNLTNNDLTINDISSFVNIFLVNRSGAFVHNDTLWQSLSLTNAMKISEYLKCDKSVTETILIRYRISSYNKNPLAFEFWNSYKHLLNETDRPKISSSDVFQFLLSQGCTQGYNKRDLLQYLVEDVLLDYMPSGDFLSRFCSIYNLLTIINSTELIDNVCISGGFLTHCLTGCNAGDIDIFCLNNTHETLVRMIMYTWSCLSFTRKNVITIFIQGFAFQIQVIGCFESTCEELIRKIDLDCCKLIYHRGKFQATKGFHLMLESEDQRTFPLTRNVDRFRMELYQEKGFNIIMGEFFMIESELTLANHNDKYIQCQWINQSPEEMLYLVKKYFGDAYGYTIFPLENASKDSLKDYH